MKACCEEKQVSGDGEYERVGRLHRRRRRAFEDPHEDFLRQVLGLGAIIGMTQKEGHQRPAIGAGKLARPQGSVEAKGLGTGE